FSRLLESIEFHGPELDHSILASRSQRLPIRRKLQASNGRGMRFGRLHFVSGRHVPEKHFALGTARSQEFIIRGKSDGPGAPLASEKSDRAIVLAVEADIEARAVPLVADGQPRAVAGDGATLQFGVKFREDVQAPPARYIPKPGRAVGAD